MSKPELIVRSPSRRQRALTLALTCGAAVAGWQAAGLYGQLPGVGEGPPPQEAPDQAAVVLAYQRASTPGDAHTRLNPLVGRWQATTEFDTPAGLRRSTAEANAAWVMNGRFLRQEFAGHLLGQPFRGLSYLGHDNITGRYQAVWLDETSTAIYVTSGTLSDDGSVITFLGDAPDPLTGAVRPFRHVLTIESDDRHTFALFEPDPNGQMRRTVIIAYDRLPEEG